MTAGCLGSVALVDVVSGSAPTLALAAGNHTSARYRAHYIVPVPTPLLRLGPLVLYVYLQYSTSGFGS